jgi:hypothetical protein
MNYSLFFQIMKTRFGQIFFVVQLLAIQLNAHTKEERKKLNLKNQSLPSNNFKRGQHTLPNQHSGIRSTADRFAHRNS